jgi:beta-lactamase superfamily II metal-dependent hydrolase
MPGRSRPAERAKGPDALRLTVYPADEGDCLLLTGGDDTSVLVDGGMRGSYRQYVAPSLARLRGAGERLALVCVSHIDQDHISGVLQLMDDLVAWRIHEFQKAENNPATQTPDAPRPPEVGAIWHNAFNEQIGENAGPVEQMLAATAAILSVVPSKLVQAVAQQQQSLATSIKEGLQLSRRVRAGQLGIPLNEPFGGRLAMVTDGARPIRMGTMRVTVIGPFPEDLRNLRQKWNDWLRDHRDDLREVQRRAREDEELLRSSELDRVLAPMVAQAEVLGRREKVTVPNLASLMLYVEEQGRTALLTGDGHHADILKGLEHAGKLKPGGGLHVNLLKVQHHGSEHNIDPEFCRRITADHYVFCANGANENPDVRVVRAIIDSRLGGRGTRGTNPEASGRFTLWFNSASAIAENDRYGDHLRKVESLVRSKADPRMRVKYRTRPGGGIRIAV